ncbi:MAG: T9SS type A sorting domain-containing protein [Bacteroidales bacterium]|nr:T9SS type A sorting domain-containing protein [Bacteroidales bacterium]
MYFLHGLGDNITRCDNEMHFANLAERFGWVIVVPQAPSVSGITMWNAGLGGTADDAGFLLALLDTLADNGLVNPDSVFFSGFSMGGFMTHRMAIEHGDRITACAPVSGLISHAFANHVPTTPVRMMHIHGTTDDVVGWNGGSSYFGNIGISVDSLVCFWTGWNNCGTDPTIDTLPDRVNDGLRFVRHTYSGEAEFQLLKVIGGTHTWYLDSNSHDIDYFEEIHSFFIGKNHSDNQATVQPENLENAKPNFEVWPNPAAGFINIRTSEPLLLTLYDCRGIAVMRQKIASGATSIDLHDMPQGIYLLSDNTGATYKIMNLAGAKR